MIDFVICEDNCLLVKEIKDITAKFFFSKNIEFKTSVFSKCTKQLDQIIKDGIPKIYILDIELENCSGLDIARKIREANDWKSVIIIISVHNELILEAYKTKTMIFNFINKLDNFKKQLEIDLDLALEILNKEKMYIYKYHNTFIRIPINNIIYAVKETSTKYCSIKTSGKTFNINKPIKDLKEELGCDFIFSHRSCIVNKNKIKELNYNKKEIIFESDDKIDLFSQRYKKDLEKSVGYLK